MSLQRSNSHPMVIYAKRSGPIVISTSKRPHETIQAALIPQWVDVAVARGIDSPKLRSNWIFFIEFYCFIEIFAHESGITEFDQDLFPAIQKRNRACEANHASLCIRVCPSIKFPFPRRLGGAQGTSEGLKWPKKGSRGTWRASKDLREPQIA